MAVVGRSRFNLLKDQGFSNAKLEQLNKYLLLLHGSGYTFIPLKVVLPRHLRQEKKHSHALWITLKLCQGRENRSSRVTTHTSLG
jgi:hypothetical protein